MYSNQWLAVNYMNTSVSNIYKDSYTNSSNIQYSYSNNDYVQPSDENIQAILTVRGYRELQNNWDSYNGLKTSLVAIQKAISFILWLSEYKIDVFYTAPSPDGDVLVEIKIGNANLEFEFTNNNQDNVCATENGDYIQSALLNETTLRSYIKWLICPNGECPPNL